MDYKLRLFTRPSNIGAGWKMFPAWRQHEGMNEKEILVWFDPPCKSYVDSLFENGKGTKENPISMPGYEVYFGQES